MNYCSLDEANNCAVSLLQRGELREASKLLKHALVELKKSQPSELFVWQNREGDTPIGERNNHQRHPSVQSCSSLTSVPVFTELFHKDQQHQDSAMVAMFNRAIHINRSTSKDDLDSSASCSMIAEAGEGASASASLSVSVLLYNAALVHHSEGLASGKSKNLRKARQMYESSFHILSSRSTAANDEIQSFANNNILLLALLNNMMQLDSYFLQLDGVNQCLCEMQHLLGTVKATTMKEEADVRWFVSNIAVPILTGSCFVLTRAPAA